LVSINFLVPCAIPISLLAYQLVLVDQALDFKDILVHAIVIGIARLERIDHHLARPARRTPRLSRCGDPNGPHKRTSRPQRETAC
jgi:hypothetical protein